MNTVVCVFKSGVFRPPGLKEYSVEYTPQHVRWLRNQCIERLSGMSRFVCMTDVEIPGVETLPLRDDLPGWWSKLEIFREFQHATYFDLDTVLVGDSSEQVFGDHKFTMASSLTRKTGFNSSVMSWKGDFSFIYHKFIDNKADAMKEYSQFSKWGDQDFIHNTMIGKHPIEHFSQRAPGLILSYKYDIRDQKNRPKVGRKVRAKLVGEWWKRPRVVCFHGSPKPYKVQAHWIPPLCAA